jgi:chloride channel 7
VKAYLNGVAARKNFNLRVLVIKVIGVILSVSSGIAAGYEGPMIHIGNQILSTHTLQGALVGDGVSSAESKALGITSKFSAFRNDRNRRDFITSGSASGLASAFTAPIGGTIFALEV